jgi:hypothetical protein
MLLSLSKTESAENPGWYKLDTPDEDVIYYRFGEPPMQRHMEASLTSAENVTWWKGLELVRIADNTIVGHAETQDNNHGGSNNDLSLGLNNFDRPEHYTLYLCKAKILGIHTRMYYIPGEMLMERRFEFYWQKD